MDDKRSWDTIAKMVLYDIICEVFLFEIFSYGFWLNKIVFAGIGHWARVYESLRKEIMKREITRLEQEKDQAIKQNEIDRKAIEDLIRERDLLNKVCNILI